MPSNPPLLPFLSPHVGAFLYDRVPWWRAYVCPYVYGGSLTPEAVLALRRLGTGLGRGRGHGLGCLGEI
jgi:hypothetical protein